MSGPIRAKSGWKALAIGTAAVYLILVLVAFAAFRVHLEGDWASAVGYEVGVALIPTIAVLLYYRYKKGKATPSGSRILCTLASWILLANLISNAGQRPRLAAEDLPVIAKEAAGLAPSSNPDDSGRSVIREYFKAIIAQNKDYQAKINELSFESLYEPQSYLSATEAKSILNQITTLLEMEEEQAAALNKVHEQFKNGINSLDWSPEEKNRFLTAFETKYQERLALQKSLMASEREWAESVRDLYAFVLTNQRDFRSSGNNVIITDTTVRNSFNEKIEHANDLRKKYDAALQAYNQKQKQNAATLGLSPQDLGLSR